MATPAEAVAAIRKVVQDFGDEHTVIGTSADVGAIQWFGRLLKWVWPHDYLEVLSKHNGVQVRDAILYGFLESFDTFLIFRDRWHEPRSFWPVAADGCGNYWVLDLGRLDRGSSVCPVVFFDAMSPEESFEETESYAAFVVKLMRKQMRNDKV